MHTLYLALYIIAAVLFALAAVNIGHPRLNLIALALLCWVAVPLIQQARAN